MWNLCEKVVTMFDKKRSLRERSREFRDVERPLTDQEATTAREIQVIFLLEQIHLDICELKQRLQVLDLYLERKDPDSYRQPADMQRLRAGR